MHTKGPWKVINKTSTNLDGTKSGQWCVETGDFTIAVIGSNKEKDAKLISAAPELLEAFKDAVGRLEDCQDNEGYPIVPEEFYKLINRAEGR